MAREFALVRTAILADDDYRDLTQPAQHLYLHLLIKADLTQCGVADWRPKRIAAYTAGLTAADVEAAAAELEAARFIVTDDDTEEVLVRSFIRHDGILKQPNMAVAMASAYAAVGSSRLRGVIVHELRRLHERSPELNGWSRSAVIDLLDHRAVDPFEGPPNPSGKGSGKGNPMGSGNPSHAFSLPLPLQTLPAPGADEASPAAGVTPDGATDETPEDAPTDIGSKRKTLDDHWSEFWALYPRKVAKHEARPAWDRARKRASVAEILDGLRRWVDDPTRDPDLKITPYPATWLNRGQWADEPGMGGYSPDAPSGDPKAAPRDASGELTPEAVDAILGREPWDLPPPPDDIEPGTRTYIEWARTTTLAHYAERRALAEAKLRERTAS